MNKDQTGIRYRYVDDTRIFEFIDSIHNLPKNNPIATFQTASDIVDYLKNQWAGLFQRFLQDQKRIEEVRVLDEMQSVAGTLRQLVGFLTEERKDKDEAIQQILLANHPIFHRFQELTETAYRIFFANEEELNRWLQARGWSPVIMEGYDEGSYREWQNRKKKKYITLTEEIFDEEGNLRVYTRDKWRDEWLMLLNYRGEENDDLPF